MSEQKDGLCLPLSPSKKYSMADLEQVLELLLGPEGCPWDKEQTHQSLRQFLIEESYEAVEAINKEDDNSLKEELGDVLFQVLFHSALAAERGAFTLEDVTDGIVRKMVERHTHIFGKDRAANASQVLDVWEKNKEKEKGYKNPKEKLSLIPRELPALMRAQKIQEKSAGYIAKKKSLGELADELEKMAAGLRSGPVLDEEERMEEIGKILLQTVQISRVLQINAEFALTNAIETFINRFEYMIDASEGEDFSRF